MTDKTRISPGESVDLSSIDPDEHESLEKEAAEEKTREHLESLDGLAYRLFAENKRSLVVVFQGMDASGKDGAIRSLASGMSPQCMRVTSFKAPSELERGHDFLWRVHAAIPQHGTIGIFNRSHYEDVVVVRVRKIIKKDVWKQRFEQINAFENLLSNGGLTFLKIFLHISRSEQRQRLEERMRDPKKQWKVGPSDLADREQWDDFQHAYEDALTKCSTTQAPWHVIPADKKWYRNLVVARLLRQALEDMDPQFPPFDQSLFEQPLV